MTTTRPRRVTFALLIYNQEQFVRAAVRGALAQDYSNLEIIISDDCSHDNSFQIIEEEVREYRGPHSVVLNRNSSNLGVGRHLNIISTLAQSEFIIVAAGDDISCPERARCLADEYAAASTEYLYVSSNAKMIDDLGASAGGLVIRSPAPIDAWRLARGSAMPLGATEGFTKGLFTEFGELPPNVANEDFVLPFRAHLIGKVIYVDKPLIQYRVSGASISRQGNGLAGREIFIGRARYLARQQIAIACMLQDICFFGSKAKDQYQALRGHRLKKELCRRLKALAVMEDYCRYRSEGRIVRAGIQLLSIPQELVAMVIDRLVRILERLR